MSYLFTSIVLDVFYLFTSHLAPTWHTWRINCRRTWCHLDRKAIPLWCSYTFSLYCSGISHSKVVYLVTNVKRTWLRDPRWMLHKCVCANVTRVQCFPDIIHTLVIKLKEHGRSGKSHRVELVYFIPLVITGIFGWEWGGKFKPCSTWWFFASSQKL